MSHWSYY